MILIWNLHYRYLLANTVDEERRQPGLHYKQLISPGWWYHLLSPLAKSYIWTTFQDNIRKLRIHGEYIATIIMPCMQNDSENEGLT